MRSQDYSHPILTLTGFDAHTLIEDVEMLLQLQTCEIGILYSAERSCDPVQVRYPDRTFIRQALHRHADIFQDRFAIHICGSTAKEQLLRRELGDIITNSNIRIQVNGVITPDELKAICDLYPDNTIITQHNLRNLALEYVDRENHSLLVDSSGGKGISPASWKRPRTEKIVGYAGGLSHVNLREANKAFRTLSYWGTDHHALPRPYWIDMETSIRSALDQFSSLECYRVQLMYLDALAKNDRSGNVRAHMDVLWSNS